MSRRHAYIRIAVALACTSVTLFTTSAYGQSPATQPANLITMSLRLRDPV